MASRPAKPEEIANGKAKGVAMKETFVAYDGIAVIVNAANPIKGSDNEAGRAFLTLPASKKILN
jgi:ABC-type phosphate transport system substrate-binding protein